MLFIDLVIDLFKVMLVQFQFGICLCDVVFTSTCPGTRGLCHVVNTVIVDCRLCETAEDEGFTLYSLCLLIVTA